MVMVDFTEHYRVWARERARKIVDEFAGSGPALPPWSKLEQMIEDELVKAWSQTG
jgi:hypothetical protein